MCAILKISGVLLAELRLTLIDETHRPLHSQLTPEDQCAFLYEYTSGQNFAYSQTNQLITNLKKSPSVRNTDQWKYKIRAMRSCSQDLARSLNPEFVAQATFVPIPPSKARDDPDYDNRMTQICHGIADGIDVRQIVNQTQTTRASHESPDRVSYQELMELYEIDETLCTPPPVSIAIMDDVITAGTHYRAMADTLRARFPGVPLFGIFIARRIYPDIALPPLNGPGN